MSVSDSKIDCQDNQAHASTARSAADTRRDDTFMRLRAALLEDRLALMDFSTENTGTDPYNSGVHRAMAKAHVWSKRSR